MNCCKFLFINKYAGLMLLMAFLASCFSLQSRHETSLAIARGGQLERVFLNTGKFRLAVYYRGLDDQSNTISVYIEGDGYAWKQKHSLSDDPTPINPMALKLAVKDASPSILYIARPCQYLNPEELKDCSPQFWSTHRYAEEVIRSVNEAVEWGVRKSGATQVKLYGYSGGGVVAALVAARRTDVVRLITVAANLDHVLWTRMQGVTPLSGSLNPADETDKLKNILQLHYAGSADDIVPVSIPASYLARFGKNEKISLEVISGFDHHCCWEDSWPAFLSKANREALPEQTREFRQ